MNSTPAKIKPASVNGDTKTLVDLALVLIADNLDAADLARVCYVCAAVGLKIESFDVDNADFRNAFGQKVDLRADEVGDPERFLPRNDTDTNGTCSIDFAIHSCLNILTEVRR